jgi:hypothetical protein
LKLADAFQPKEHALSATAIEFAIEDLFLLAKVELPFCDSDNDFPAHDLK